MGATPGIVGGPRSARRPSPAPPRRVRWPRRIAGVIATGGLIAVAVAMYSMLAPKPAPTAPAAAAGAPKPARVQALTYLHNHGFAAVDPAAYDSRRVLRVLVGHRIGQPAGPRRAFFFAGRRFVGTDAPAGSTGLRVVAGGKRWVTLAYGRYAVGDKPCCPNRGRVKVRFDLRAGKVVPAQALPGESARVATG
jgi:hypothetical protein